MTSMANDDAEQLKVILLGDASVGKTTFCNRTIYGETPKTRMTMGPYFLKKTVNINGTLFEVNLWDTAGEEKFHSLMKMHTNGAHCAIVMYDVTIHSSWKAVNRWLSDLTDDCVVIIVGNKRMSRIIYVNVNCSFV